MYLRAMMAVGLCSLLTGCASSARLTDTLPEAVEEQIEPVDTNAGVALRYLPNPDADRLEVDLGAVSLRMNRLFSGMLTEMAQQKFGRVDREAENRLVVAVTYLNLEERRYMGATRLYRVEMAVAVTVADAARSVSREFEQAAVADLEGYSVRSDQLYDLLLHFVAAIDEYVNAFYQDAES